MKKLFVIILALFVLVVVEGCSYGGIASLPEQIAIYQNMGFNACPLADGLVFGQTSLKLNDIEHINNYLLEQHCDVEITKATIMYLQSDNEDKLDGLIFIYYFENNQSAQQFYNLFAPKFPQCLKLYGSVVIQKGQGYIINSSAKNTYYYNKFISGLKN